MEVALRKKDIEPRFTYGDYLQWNDGERWELIDGMPYAMFPAETRMYAMPPSPSRMHQSISGELLRQISNFLLDKSCEVFAAPFDVRLPKADEPDEQIRDVVQPDIVVVCDQKKLDEKGCRGGPDFVIEILSPASAQHDQVRKLKLYEKRGVREYWIVDPATKRVIVRLLNAKGRFDPPRIYDGAGSLAVATLPGLSIDLGLVFRQARTGTDWHGLTRTGTD
ncbi:MAG: Uma2 family endonuclease [Candidatus Sumerlaeota bacterium]|nr:Uma2 family endonuclease [Candidatus Sumerlaeota bacterium]